MKKLVRLALLKALSRLYRPAGQPTSRSGKEQRVLVLRPDHLGDVLFTTPSLRLLRLALPRAQITCMVGEWCKEVMNDNPNVDEVMACHFPGFTRQPKDSPLAPYTLLWAEVKRLRHYDFNLAINLRFDFWWGAMLAYFVGIPERIGYDIPECKPFLTRAIPYVAGRHEVEQNITLVSATGNGLTEVERDSLNLEFSPKPADEDLARDWFSHFVDSSRLIALHPGAGAPVKLWHADSFAQVGDELAHRYGAKIILTGSFSERALVQEIANKMTCSPLSLVGVSLSQLAAVLRRCVLVIGTDSGVLHLAVAMRVPTVHLYGPVSEVAFGPWADLRCHKVVKAEPVCVPCNRLDFPVEELGQHLCVKSIPAERVLAVAETLL